MIDYEKVEIMKTMTARINGCPIIVNIVNDYAKGEVDVFVSIPDPSFDNPGDKLFTYHESNMHWTHSLEYDIQKSLPEAKEEEIKEFVKEVYDLYEGPYEDGKSIIRYSTIDSYYYQPRHDKEGEEPGMLKLAKHVIELEKAGFEPMFTDAEQIIFISKELAHLVDKKKFLEAFEELNDIETETFEIDGMIYRFEHPKTF